MPPTSRRAITSPSNPPLARVMPRQERHNLTHEQPVREDKGFHPVVGIIATITGTVLAMATVPFNPHKEGVLWLPGVLMCLGLGIAPLLAFLQNPRNILRTENIIGMAAIYWLFMDLVTAVYDLPSVNRNAVRTSFISAGAFVTMFWIATMQKPWKLPKVFLTSCSFRPEISVILPITMLSFVLAMLAYAIPCEFDLALMFKSVLGHRWAAPWARSDIGGWNAFVDHLNYFGYLLPTLAVMVMRRKGWLHPATIVAMAFAVIFLIFLMHSGARRIIGVCLGSALIYWVLDRERVRIWQLIMSAAGIVAVLWVMQAMLVFRGVGVGEVGASNAAIIAWKTMQGESAGAGTPKGLAVDDNFYRLAQVHSIVPEHHPWVYWKYVWYVMVRPIPRVFWEGKPMDGGFKLQDFDDQGASLSISIVGEAWLSWGYPAVLFVGWVFGRLSRMNNPLFLASSGSVGPMFYGYMTMMLFVGWRSLQEVLLFSYALLGWMFAAWLYAKIRGRRFDES
ncbi:MAG TPA: oligosaccharide repeat unit polymerase [Candidatus Saccharimonadia bacterium]|nr:oligosaccharide repeat unit polymerase [Candidatus Saccharimonadia bacterium]